MDNKPIFQFDRGKGLHLDLYPNRLVVTEGWPSKKEKAIPTSQIASVEYTRLGNLEIETTGGKKYKWSLGPQGKDLKTAIEQLL